MLRNSSAVALVIGAMFFVLVNALAIGTWMNSAGLNKTPAIEAPTASTQ
jgi:hypothetical protein